PYRLAFRPSRALPRDDRCARAVAAAAERVSARRRRRRHRRAAWFPDDHAAATRRRPLAHAQARPRPPSREPGAAGSVLLVHGERRRRPRHLPPTVGPRAAARSGQGVSRRLLAWVGFPA